MIPDDRQELNIMPDCFEEQSFVIDLPKDKILQALDELVLAFEFSHISVDGDRVWIISKAVPKDFDDETVLTIIQNSALYASTVRNAIRSDRERSITSILGLGESRVRIHLTGDSDTTSRLTIRSADYDRVPSIRTEGAGLVAIKTAVPSLRLEYALERTLTVRDLMEYLVKKNTAIRCAECGSEGMLVPCPRCSMLAREKKIKKSLEAQDQIMEGIADGTIESLEDAILIISDEALAKEAWRDTQEKRTKAYWGAHPEDYEEITKRIEETRHLLEQTACLSEEVNKDLERLPLLFHRKERAKLQKKAEDSRHESAKLRKEAQRLESSLENPYE